VAHKFKRLMNIGYFSFWPRDRELVVATSGVAILIRI
jgi:hypothetical protein